MARHLLIRGCKECPKCQNKNWCLISKKPVSEKEYAGKFPDHCRLPKVKPIS